MASNNIPAPVTRPAGGTTRCAIFEYEMMSRGSLQLSHVRGVLPECDPRRHQGLADRVDLFSRAQAAAPARRTSSTSTAPSNNGASHPPKNRTPDRTLDGARRWPHTFRAVAAREQNEGRHAGSRQGRGTLLRRPAAADARLFPQRLPSARLGHEEPAGAGVFAGERPHRYARDRPRLLSGPDHRA